MHQIRSSLALLLVACLISQLAAASVKEKLGLISDGPGAKVELQRMRRSVSGDRGGMERPKGLRFYNQLDRRGDKGFLETKTKRKLAPPGSSGRFKNYCRKYG